MTTLDENDLRVTAPLDSALAAFTRRFPGDSPARQPVHTVYGGAQLFRSDTPKKLGALALGALEEHAPDAAAFASAIGLHPSVLRVYRGHEFLTELDALLGDVAVMQPCLCGGPSAEHDVQLREPEDERVVLIDERDVDLVCERVGESRRQLQAREAGTKDQDVLLHRLGSGGR